ncbi:MAG: xanthine dehydrogenase family protein molybdopterin-binding subunit [Anaerolineae bacterium]|nr:xanthine dehydrogenase family protein molybdopterin-binding subunit [Anaerolineae bacterium]
MNQQATDFSVIGTRPPRVDAAEKVIGRAKYGMDAQVPGVTYGKVLRSPHAHARIVSIDTGKAEALAGVYAVVTADDLLSPETREKLREEDNIHALREYELTLAHDKVLFEGHPIAAVAARTPTLAEQAVKLIEVEYEVLPAVVGILDAMRDDAPLLHEMMHTESLAGKSEKPSNVASYFQQIKGDPEQGFAKADVVVEREFRSLMVHQGYIEPHAATAEWSPTGKLTLYTTTQGTFAVRDHVVSLLHIPMSDTRVISLEVGGAFGGKNNSFVDAVAALLARKARRPVKVTMSRAETLLGTGPSSGTVIRVKMGATREGHITATQATLYYEAGAYPGSPVGSGVNVMFGPYDISHVQVEGYDIVNNKPPIASYRAPGATPANFAIEVVIDEIAEKIGMDPLEFRLLNSAREGTEQIFGEIHHDIGAIEVLEAAKAHPHYSAPLAGSSKDGRRGRGVAHGYWGNWGARSSCTITVNPDGTVALVTGSVDVTGTRTSLAMQAAEILCLDLDQVKSSVGDTDNIGYSDVSAGSRTTIATGQAVIQAAQEVIAKMCARAATIWEVPVETITFEGGIFATNADKKKRMTFAELAAQLPQTGNTVIGVANVDVREWGAAFGTHIVDVEVDPETGLVTLLRYTAVQDVGKAIHPTQVEGQIQGGAVQGIGWALYEGYTYNAEGKLLNPNFLDYKLPTALDVPPIDTVIVEVPYPKHPFGARGVGEVPIIPPPAAIANAIYRAIGARVDVLPMTPGRILEAMGVMG